MANSIPTELSSLTYAGTDIQRSDLAIHLEVVRGIYGGLAVRGEDTVVPGLGGEIPRNRMKDTREIELVGRVMGTGATQANQNSNVTDHLDTLDALFRPDRTPATLSGTARDGTTRSILCRPLPGGLVLGPEEAPGTRQVSVVLVSVVPDWTVT